MAHPFSDAAIDPADILIAASTILALGVFGTRRIEQSAWGPWLNAGYVLTIIFFVSAIAATAFEAEIAFWLLVAAILLSVLWSLATHQAASSGSKSMEEVKSLLNPKRCGKPTASNTPCKMLVPCRFHP